MKPRKLAAVTAVMIIIALWQPVSPATGLAASSSEAQNVQNEINNLNVQLAEAVDRYDKQAARLDELIGAIEQNQNEMDAAARELGRAITILNNRAVGIYKRGSVSSLEVIFNSKNFNDFVTQLDLLTRVGDRDAVIVKEVAKQKLQIETNARELDKQRKDQESLTNDLADQRDVIDSQLTNKENVLASILEDIAAMDAAEAERQSRRSRARGARRSGASLTNPLPGGGWGYLSPGEESDHYKYGGSGHGVWLYEYSNEGMSDAIDIGGPGDIVYAAHSGTVIWTSSGSGGVTVISGEGFITCYAHSTPFFGTGDFVYAGQAIAEVSMHLHFELLDGGEFVPAGDFQTYF
ncbi:MAG: peptidoglycan DD-metalloendopeptidase family protein [Actinomycetota bacterium]